MSELKRITPSEAARRNGVNRSRIHKLLQEKRIPGAVQLENGSWLLPENFHIKRPPTRASRRMAKLG